MAATASGVVPSSYLLASQSTSPIASAAATSSPLASSVALTSPPVPAEGGSKHVYRLADFEFDRSLGETFLATGFIFFFN